MSRLLSHYWTADDEPAARQAQIEDWIEDLVEFGPDIAAAACGEWRRRPGGKRPTPGDIRALCREFRPVSSEPMIEGPDDELTARRMADEWAIARGFMSIEDFQSKNFVSASIKLRRGGWVTYPGRRKVDIQRPPPVPGFVSPAAALGVVAARE